MSKITCTIILILAFIISVMSQAPPPPGGMRINSSDSFESLQGGFRIDLRNLRGYEPLSQDKTHDLGKGGLFSFEESQVQFFVGYVNLDKQLKPSELDEKILKIPSKLFGYNLENIDTRKSAIDGLKLIDIKGDYRLKHWIRFVTKDDKLIILIARYELNYLSIKVKSIYDSLELFSAADEIAKKVEQATPSELPQSPQTARKSTDAEEEDLRGRVKFVRKRFIFDKKFESCDLESGRLNLEQHFNRDGNLVNQTRYDAKELPFSITVFGYLDGKRVSNYGSISYASNPPAMALPASSKPRDLRYKRHFEYKYDDQNRLIRKRVFDNKGELEYKTTREYKENTAIYKFFRNPDKPRSITLEEFDKEGRLITETSVDNNLKPKTAPYRYIYKCIDKYGNWTNKIRVKIPLESEEDQRITYWITTREIVYYE